MIIQGDAGCILFQRKSDVFSIFKVFKVRVELEFGKKIKCLRREENTQVMILMHFINKKALKRQYMTSYTPQQNRVAERMNRTLL